METYNNIYNLPVLPLRGLVVFPKTMLHFDVAREQSKRAVKTAMNNNQLIFLVAQKDPAVKEPTDNDLFSIGVIAKIIQVLKQPDGYTRVIVEGLKRAYINEFIDNKKCIYASLTAFEESYDNPTAHEIALVRQIKATFDNYARFIPKLSSDVMFRVATCDNGGELADFIAGNTLPDYNDKQLILETIDVIDRLETLLDILSQEIYILKIEEQIGEKAREKIDKSQREYFLREQKSIIEEELGEDDNPLSESEEYKNRILELKLTEETETALLKECSKLSKMPSGSHDVPVITTYLDTILDLPWTTATKDKLNLKQIERKLNKNHYGLNKVKERIIEQFAVRKLNPDIKGQIICLVGPPGVGKTSIATSLSDAIGRKSARIALGGVRDEAEIRGHRRTYVGAMPGNIVAGLKQAGVKNPLMLLDEIDKTSADHKGDVASALLEVLDSEQNSKFRDHFVGIPIDLSEVLFIATANSASDIPGPLYDRMEIIEVSSYTANEKFHIAKEFLLKKQYEKNGLKTSQISINDAALKRIIEAYTKEAGVRELERKIGEICRKAAREILEKGTKKVTVTAKNLESFLGKEKYRADSKNKKDEIGIVRGLAWTPVGGTTLSVEVNIMPGKGEMELTGQMGDVMKESALAGLSFIRSIAPKYKIDRKFFEEHDIHIHIPEGAVPKDGPSAGITMATAVMSAITGTPVSRNLAMTGEITLRGRVLAVGGLKEKILAAKTAGIKKVLVPLENKPDIEEISEEIKEGMDLIYVSSMKEVLEIAFW